MSAVVVICFHFTIFVVLETTYFFHGQTALLLWFAFILLSLSYWKQPDRWGGAPCRSCDLLSFYYLCRTGNNNSLIVSNMYLVVICFHFTIFVVLETTVTLVVTRNRCCDLLSFYYLCRTGNNYLHILYLPSSVVICFHFTIFVVLETTKPLYFCPNAKLWFAFILLSLSYWKQLNLYYSLYVSAL